MAVVNEARVVNETKHVVILITLCYSLLMSKRTAKVIMTNEARVLKQIREELGFSMREAAIKAGVSSSLVSQIENGRENFPQGERLHRFLEAYGIQSAVFKRRVSVYNKKLTDKEVIEILLPKLKKDQLKMVRMMMEQFLN